MLPELDRNLWKQCLHLLYKLCKACELLPTSHVLQQEFIHVGDIRCYGGFADVNEGDYLGRRVAIKHLRFRTKDAFDKIFKVPESSSTMLHPYSLCIQRFCREVLGWKRLSHPNILPLLGVSVTASPRSFRIVSDWMQNGNVMEYIRSNPEVDRLQLVSSLVDPVLAILNDFQLSGAISGVAYLHGLGVIHGDLKGVLPIDQIISRFLSH